MTLVAGLAACGGPPKPEAVETCLREEGLNVARQPGVSPPVEAKVNFTTSGTPVPESPGTVVFYASESEAVGKLAAAGPRGELLRREGAVLYSPFRASGTPEESAALVKGCVTSGEAGGGAEEDDSDTKKKKKKR